MVSPLHKGTSNKNDISNFRPISTLTTFSKIYERVTQKMIDKAMGKCLSSFISAYRQNHSIQHVLIRLLEEWRKDLDNNWCFHGFDDYLVNYLYSYVEKTACYNKISGVP